MNHVNWMENNYLILKNRKINRIILPGTHDSGAYLLDFSHNIGNKKIKFVNFMSKYISFVKHIIEDWTLTQNLSIYHQLSNGVRSFDFRVSLDKNTNTFYITHTFTCMRLDKVLYDIYKFMSEYPKEILILTFSSDFAHKKEMTKEENDIVINKIYEILGNIICYPSNNYSFKTLEEMVQMNSRIIIYYNGRGRQSEFPFLWSFSYIYSPWNNTDELSKKIKMLDEDFDKMKSESNLLNMIGFTLTPQKKTVIKDIRNRILLPFCYRGKSVKYLAKSIQNELDPIINKNQDKIDILSVIYTDFINENFVNYVIALNFVDNFVDNFFD